MPTAEIITIGTELLLGETPDTNTRVIARTLRSLGIDLFHTQTIGDNAGRIAESVRLALGRADVIITTGGLGPTVDDPTRQAIAQAADARLEYHPELWEQIAARISRYGRSPTENQKRQAFIPRGAIVIENPVGTAPAFIVEIGQGVVISLPGVPLEMETLMEQAVIPYLKAHFDLHAVLKIRTLHVSGLGEGTIDDRIGDLEGLTNPTVGLTAHSGVVDIRIAAKSESGPQADQAIAKVEDDLRDRLGENIFGVEEDTLEGVTLEAVRAQGWRLAVFEYHTGSALQARLARLRSTAYLGGELLETPPAAMSAQAERLRAQFKAEAVLGVLLFQQGEKQEIHILFSTPLGQKESHLTYGGHPGSASRWATNNALDGLRRFLKEAG